MTSIRDFINITEGYDEKVLKHVDPAIIERAKAEGFDTTCVYYHGTASEFEQLRASQEGSFGSGVYLSLYAHIASDYAVRRSATAGSGNVWPVFVRGRILSTESSEYFAIQDRGRRLQRMGRIPDSPEGFQQWEREQFAQAGYTGVGFTASIAVFDADNVRSIFAFR